MSRRAVNLDDLLDSLYAQKGQIGASELIEAAGRARSNALVPAARPGPAPTIQPMPKRVKKAHTCARAMCYECQHVTCHKHPRYCSGRVRDVTLGECMEGFVREITWGMHAIQQALNAVSRMF
jgi:hypothetical protein